MSGNISNQPISASFDNLLQIESNDRVTTALGNAPTDIVFSNLTSSNLDVTGSIYSDLIPDSNNTRDLGSSTKSWDKIYGNTISGSFTGDGSSLSGVTATAAPGGPNTSVQFNDSSTTSGSSDFTFNKTTGGVTATSFSGSFSGSITGIINNNVFSGSHSGDGSNLTGIPSSSYSYTSSYFDTTNSKIHHDANSNLLIISSSDNIQMKSSNFELIGDFKTVKSIAANTFVNAKEYQIKNGLSRVSISGSNLTGTRIQQLGDKSDTFAYMSDIANVTSSAHIFSGSFSGSFNGDGSNITNVTASSVEYASVLNKPTLLSGSAQIATDISGSFNVHSSSLSTRVTSLETNSGSFSTRVTSLETDSGSFSTRVTTNETSITGINGATGSYATTGSNIFQSDQTVFGNFTVSGSIVNFTSVDAISGSFFSGSAFVGDGSGLTNVSSVWDGNIDGNVNITGSLTVSSSNVNFIDTNGVSGSFSGSFSGDGSNLTGITAEWDGSHNGNASITGSLNVTSVTSSFNGSGNDITFTSNTQKFSGSFSGSHSGDGSNLTGVTSAPGGNASSIQFSDAGIMSGSNSFEYDKGNDLVRSTNTFEVTGSTNLSGSNTLIGTTTIKGNPNQNAGLYVADNSDGSVLNPTTNDKAAIFVNTKAGTIAGSVKNSVVIGGDRTGDIFTRNNTVFLPNVEGDTFSSSFSGSFQGDGSSLTGVAAASVSGGLQAITDNGTTTTNAIEFLSAVTASSMAIKTMGANEVLFSTDASGSISNDSTFTYNDSTQTLATKNLNITDSTTLGSNANDTLAINADVETNIIPDSDNVRQIGDSTNRWKVFGKSSEMSGSFSGSFFGDGNKITNIPSSSLSNVLFSNKGDGAVQDVEGSLKLTGDIIAENYIISSSVTYMTQSFSSGSTIFGDEITDTHIFTGSLYVTGSTNLEGALILNDPGNLNYKSATIKSKNSYAQIEFDNGNSATIITSDSGSNNNGGALDVQDNSINMYFDGIQKFQIKSTDTKIFDANANTSYLGFLKNSGHRIGLTTNTLESYELESGIYVTQQTNYYGGINANMSHIFTGSVYFAQATGSTTSIIDFTKMTAMSGSEISASTYYGDGSNLTGIVASNWTSSANGISRYSDVAITGSLNLSGSIAIEGQAYSTLPTTHTPTTTTQNIDWNDGNGQVIDLASAPAGGVTASFSNPNGGATYLLKVIQKSAGSASLDYPSNVMWASGITPTISVPSGSIDLIVFFYDGVSYLGSINQNFS